MKVIFLKDVPRVGRKYEVKDVSDGHAVNFLIPRGFVEPATEGVLKRAETLKKQHDAEKKIREDLIMKNLDDLDGTVVEMIEKANDKGHLFAGIHVEEVAEAIGKQTRLEVSPEHILMEKAIKTLGEHELEAQIQDKKVKFKLSVKEG